MASIVNEMLKKDNAVAREIVKVAMTAQLVCDGLGEFNDCEDIYDMIISQDDIDFSKDIKNYDMIEELYKKETSVEVVLNKFLTDLNKNVDKSMKKLLKDGKDFNIEDLKEVVNIVQKNIQ